MCSGNETVAVTCEDLHVHEPPQPIDIHGGGGGSTSAIFQSRWETGTAIVEERARERERDGGRSGDSVDCECKRSGRVSTPPSQEPVLTTQPVLYLHHRGGTRLWGKEESIEREVGRQTCYSFSCVLWDRRRCHAKGEARREGVKESDNCEMQAPRGR